MIKRTETWQEDFTAFIKKHEKTPFKWGDNDCIMFPALAAQSITGIDFIKRNAEEGRDYSTRAQASEMLKAHFKNDIENVFTYFLGASFANVSYAKRGDVVVFMQGKEKVGGVIDSTGRKIICAGRKGLLYLPKSIALNFWKVGK